MTRGTFSLVLALTIASVTAAQPQVAPPEKYATALAHVEKLVQQELTDKKLPAISIAIVDDQTVVWAKGFGSADPEKKIPATAQTVYPVGSVSKLFTDVAVMQLAEQKKLDLDAPVTNYLPEFRPKNPSGKPITLRHLMTHRSGLIRESSIGNYFDKDNQSLEQMVASLNATELVYPPETKIKYSNSGIAVVGYTLQRTQKEPFAKYVKRAVLEPLGMTRSTFEPEPALMPDVAKAIMWSPHGRQFPAPTFELGMAPAGCMYSSVLDLAQFLKVLAADGKGMLTKGSLDEMWRPQFAGKDEKTGIGLGFFIGELHGQRRIGHNGAIYGFATELAYLPDSKLGVVVAISCDCANPVGGRIADFATDTMLAAREGKPLPELISPKPVEAEWQKRIVGTWVDDTTKREVTAEMLGGKVWLWPHRGGMRVELKQAGDELIVDDRLGFGTRIKWVDGRPKVGDATWTRKDVDAKPTAIPD